MRHTCCWQVQQGAAGWAVADCPPSVEGGSSGGCPGQRQFGPGLCLRAAYAHDVCSNSRLQLHPAALQLELRYILNAQHYYKPIFSRHSFAPGLCLCSPLFNGRDSRGMQTAAAALGDPYMGLCARMHTCANACRQGFRPVSFVTGVRACTTTPCHVMPCPCARTDAYAKAQFFSVVHKFV